MPMPMDPSTMMIEVIWGILGHLGYFRSLEYFRSFGGSFEVIWGVKWGIKTETSIKESLEDVIWTNLCIKRTGFQRPCLPPDPWSGTGRSSPPPCKRIDMTEPSWPGSNTIKLFYLSDLRKLWQNLNSVVYLIKHCTIVIYNSRVVLTRKLPILWLKSRNLRS